MIIENETYLDFSDVLLKPKRSTLSSRSEVNLVKEFKPKYGQPFRGVPIMAANMATGTFEMANEFAKHQMFVAIAKHNNYKWIEEFDKNPGIIKTAFYTIGMSDLELDGLQTFREHVKRSSINHMRDYNELGVDPNSIKICVDIANGYTQKFADFVRKVRSIFEFNVIIAGNVATPEMTEELIIAGADYVKCGVGSGSVCSTRKITGIGVPQLSAVINCFEPNTIINTNNGTKKIKDITIGDFVLTHKLHFKKVIGKIITTEAEHLYNINGNKSTKNHEYYVVNRQFVNELTDDNIHTYAEWVSAEELDSKIHLLIKENIKHETAKYNKSKK